MHGNEAAGVHALRSVLPALAARRADVAGEFVAVLGNRRALARGRRFLERDLNRAWTEGHLGRLRGGTGAGAGGAEDREQIELLETIEAVVRRARGPVHVMDLHTTSGLGGPFSTFGDTLANREFAAHVPVPMIVGLEELVDGTLLAFLGEHGLVALVFESGQHQEPEAVERAEAGLWIAVAASGLVPPARLPEASEGWKRLHRECRPLPRALEMRYRHPVEPDDGFVMRPGYLNFQPVEEGEIVAEDRTGPVRVTERARILMPLYQVQGEDGFFLVREFRPFWLWVSSALRRLRVDRVAHWLPGVHRDPADPDARVVDKRVARWFALQLFHLLGFRKVEDAGHRLVVRRRGLRGARFLERPAEDPPAPPGAPAPPDG